MAQCVGGWADQFQARGFSYPVYSITAIPGPAGTNLYVGEDSALFHFDGRQWESMDAGLFTRVYDIVQFDDSLSWPSPFAASSCCGVRPG